MIMKLKSDHLWAFFNKKALPKSTSSRQITWKAPRRGETHPQPPEPRAEFPAGDRMPSHKVTANRLSATRLRGESWCPRAVSWGNLLKKESWSKFQIS